jgi:hypothetical protein
VITNALVEIKYPEGVYRMDKKKKKKTYKEKKSTWGGKPHI